MNAENYEVSERKKNDRKQLEFGKINNFNNKNKFENRRFGKPVYKPLKPTEEKSPTPGPKVAAGEVWMIKNTLENEQPSIPVVVMKVTESGATALGLVKPEEKSPGDIPLRSLKMEALEGRIVAKKSRQSVKSQNFDERLGRVTKDEMDVLRFCRA